jgi:hypothetical protein
MVSKIASSHLSQMCRSVRANLNTESKKSVLLLPLMTIAAYISRLVLSAAHSITPN